MIHNLLTFSRDLMKDILIAALETLIVSLKNDSCILSEKKMEDIAGYISYITKCPEYFDRTNAIKYLNVSESHFNKLISTGTKFKPIKPILEKRRVKGMVKAVYLKSDLDKLIEDGNLKEPKKRGKYTKQYLPQNIA